METRIILVALGGMFASGYVVGSTCAFKWCARKITKFVNALPEELQEAANEALNAMREED